MNNLKYNRVFFYRKRKEYIVSIGFKQIRKELFSRPISEMDKLYIQDNPHITIYTDLSQLLDEQALHMTVDQLRKLNSCLLFKGVNLFK